MTTHLISYTHSRLSLLKAIIPYFSPLKLYIPWGGTVPEVVDDRDITASFPPEGLRPETDINQLLNEYLNWAYEQGEKSRREIVKAGYTNPASSESMRRIRTILTSRISDTSEKDINLKWHMLLHLKKRFEEQRHDANSMLEGLKNRPSPLLNNADLTERTKYPFENLTEISQESLLSNDNIKLLLRAWHGLFSSLIDEKDLLMTIDRRIIDRISEAWDISCGNSGQKQAGIVTFKGPFLKKTGMGVQYLRDITIGDNIRNIVISNMTQGEKISALTNLAKEFESIYQYEFTNNYILFSIIIFQSYVKSREIITDSFLKFLSGRTLLFAEING